MVAKGGLLPPTRPSKQLMHQNMPAGRVNSSVAVATGHRMAHSRWSGVDLSWRAGHSVAGWLRACPCVSAAQA